MNHFTFNGILCITVCILLQLCANAQGYHWETSIIIPTNTARFSDTYFFDRDTGLIISDDGRIFKTYDQCSIWHTKYSGTGATFRSIEFSENHNTGICGAINGKIYRSADRGETWSDITNNVPDTGIQKNRICGLAHYGDTHFYGVGWWGGHTARFFKSTDAGQSWSVSFLDSNLATSLIDIVALDTQVLYACGGRFIHGKRYSVILKSGDGGGSWNTIFIDSTFGGRIWKLQFLSNTLVYGAVEPYYFPDTVNIIKSTDGGNNWDMKHIGRRPSMGNIGTQAVGFINPQVGWVGGWYQGLFETTDGGNTWSFQTPPEAYNMNRIFRINDTTLYATTGSGLMKYMKGWPEKIGPQPQPYTPSHTLYPVYPNPAGDKVSIVFDVKKQTNVVIEIVDITGRRYEHIASGFMTPGHYTFHWDTSGKPPGNYMVWMGTDEIPLVQKFIISGQ